MKIKFIVLYVFILCLLVFSACKKNYKILSEEKFVKVIAEIFYLNQLSNELYATQIDSAKLYCYLLEKYKISKSDLDSSIKYYFVKNEKKFKKINNVLLDELLKRSEYVKTKIEEEKEEILLKNTKKYKFNFLRKPFYFIETDIKGQGEYKVSAKVKLNKNDKSPKPALYAYFYKKDSLDRVLVDSFPAIILQKNNQEILYFSNKVLNDTTYNKIRFEICNDCNKYKRSFVIKDIKIVKIKSN